VAATIKATVCARPFNPRDVPAGDRSVVSFMILRPPPKTTPVRCPRAI
jgi:hypothetical protein